MSDPHNYRKVGYSMVAVSASLTAIALLALAIGDDVLYADDIQREKTAHFEECRDSGFAGEGCLPYGVHMEYERCVAERDLDDPACYRYRTWVESAIFEECRAAGDTTSGPCLKYAGLY